MNHRFITFRNFSFGDPDPVSPVRETFYISFQWALALQNSIL